jgi:hypothetical protein
MPFRNSRRYVTGLLIAGAAALAGPATHATAPPWHTVPGPRVPAGDSGNLTGVSMAGPSDGWAVGSELPSTPGSDFQPLIAHWDGRRWRAVPVSLAAVTSGRLDGAAALSPSDVWAVGAVSRANHTSAPLIARWNGRRWARVRSAGVPGYSDARLLAVAAASRADAWAVGQAENTAGQLRPLIEHWNGRTWSLMPSPSQGTMSFLSDVTVARNGAAWAVGGSFGQLSRPFVVRWTGHAWVTAATPRSRSHVDLASVTAVSPAQVWAVGEATAPASPPRPYAMRWNGHQWRTVRLPSAGPAHDGQELISVAPAGGDRLVAVGADLGAANQGALYARWNGRRWSVTVRPGDGIALTAVTAGGQQLWAVGALFKPGNAFLPIVQVSR